MSDDKTFYIKIPMSDLSTNLLSRENRILYDFQLFD